MNDPYWAVGCDVCRTSWRFERTIDEDLGRSASLDATIFRCRVCGTFWQTTGHDAVLPISEERAAAALAGDPRLVKDAAAHLPEFLEIRSARSVAAPDGRRRPPSAPLWDPGSGATELWKADMLSSIADVLDIPLPHLFRWGTARAEVAGSQVGYGMIVDRDTLDWVKVSRELDLPGDVTPDVREGPVHAIGVNARILLTPGAQDVHAVGSDAAGRAQVARRHADYEAWKAIR